MAKRIATENIINTKLKDYKAEQPLGERKIVSTSEKGKTFRIKFDKVKPSAVYTIDGNILTEGDKCDKLVLIQSDVSQNKWIEVFVELKGKGVSHAVDQLKATIDKPVFTHKTIDKRWARIVAQSFPRNTGNSVIERARDYFQKKGIDFKRGTITMEEAI